MTISSRIIALMATAALLALVAIWGIQSLSPQHKPSSEPAFVMPPNVKPDVPSDWVLMDQAEGFSVYGPSGTSHHRQNGIDWGGGHFDAPDFSWGYYIGFTPQPLHAEGDPKFFEEPVQIDGRSGIIQRFIYPADRVKDGRRYYSRLLLERAFARYDYGSTDHALDLYGWAVTPAAPADMERMWRSIRFDLREVRDLAPVHGGIK
jgi:hypothetical protein